MWVCLISVGHSAGSLHVFTATKQVIPTCVEAQTGRAHLSGYEVQGIVLCRRSLLLGGSFSPCALGAHVSSRGQRSDGAAKTPDRLGNTSGYLTGSHVWLKRSGITDEKPPKKAQALASRADGHHRRTRS